MRTRPTTVSLVLGSGGARGLAHIGVIERMQVLRLLDPTFCRDGLFKGERIMGVLRELIGDHTIEELPVSFTAVATDLESGEEVWLREGKLFDAIRASIATPMVFTPFLHGERTLLDGALVNPLPIGPTLNDATDLTVVVNLSGLAELQPVPVASTQTVNGDSYRQRVRSFIDSLHLARSPAPGPLTCHAVTRPVRCRRHSHADDAGHHHAPQARGLLTGRHSRHSAQRLHTLRVLARSGVDRARPRACGAEVCQERALTRVFRQRPVGSALGFVRGKPRRQRAERRTSDRSRGRPAGHQVPTVDARCLSARGSISCRGRNQLRRAQGFAASHQRQQSGALLRDSGAVDSIRSCALQKSR